MKIFSSSAVVGIIFASCWGAVVKAEAQSATVSRLNEILQPYYVDYEDFWYSTEIKIIDRCHIEVLEQRTPANRWAGDQTPHRSIINVNLSQIESINREDYTLDGGGRGVDFTLRGDFRGEFFAVFGGSWEANGSGEVNSFRIVSEGVSRSVIGELERIVLGLDGGC